MANIVLIGFMGSGKSTVASKLSENYKVPVIEMDQMIEQEEGCKISEIFTEKGEKYFRELEMDFLKKLDWDKEFILSTGGGVILKEANRKILKEKGRIFYLQADSSHILKNIKKGEHRPLLEVEEVEKEIQDLLAFRASYYQETADKVVHVTGQTVAKICATIIEIVEGE